MADDLFNRIRRAQTSPAARQTLAEQEKARLEETKLPSILDPLTADLRNLEKELKAIAALQRCILANQEEFEGNKDDQQMWQPFAFDVPAASQVVTSALVDSDVTFFYSGYGGSAISGVSWQEIIDGSQGPVHYTPPNRPEDTDPGQYGTKGRRVYSRVDLVIQNATGAPVSIDGWFRGRFRKGGR